MDILGLIFPKKCINCGKGEKYICSNCLSRVSKAKLVCPMCDKPSIDGMVHFRCKKKFGLDGLISIWEYEGVVRKGILALKYKFARDILDELVNASLTRLKDLNIPKEGFIWIPIPIHFLRQNWRGFNQSELIGAKTAKTLNFKFASDLILKKKRTASQTEFKGRERKENIKGVFVLNPKFKIKKGQNFIIFDDVWTTGSTIKEAAKILKRGGAGKVWGLTITK